MKALTASLIIALALFSPIASAQTIRCPGVGEILLNGDSAILTYAPSMGFSDNNDTASFVSMSHTETDYRANKWGALITIPNDLIDGGVAAADVQFWLPESAPQIERCTAE